MTQENYNDEDPRNGMFAIMWDCYGLEAVAQVPNPADATFARLKGVPPPAMPNVHMWELRARFNPQRNYEIYLITAVPGISADDIRDMFERDPQGSAETIRRIGQMIVDHRESKQRVIQ